MSDPLAPTSERRSEPPVPRWPSRWLAPQRIRDTIAPLAVAALLAALLLGAVAYRLITLEKAWDYVFHMEVARLTRSGVLLPPHFLFHLAVIAVHEVLPGDHWAAAVLVVLMAFQAVLVAMLFVGLLAPLRRRGVEGAGLAAAFLAFGLVTVSAIPLFALRDGHLYFGYVPTNTYHSPTVVVLRPLALGLFLVVVRAFSAPESARGWRWAAAATALSVSATLAKPLYTLCLLPALLVMGAWRTAAGRPVASRPLLAWVVAPAGLVLAVQSVLGARIQGPFEVVLAPFLSMGARSEWLLPKYLLSLLFPLTVAVTFRSALRGAELALAWASFLFGSFYAYFLAEAGPRAFDGNFWWGAQVALFVLFYASLRACLEREAGPAPHPGGTRYGRALLACLAAFGLHLVAGVVWYYAHAALIFSW